MAATEEKDVEKTISEDLVVTKYKLAGEIVNSKYLFLISISLVCGEKVCGNWTNLGSTRKNMNIPIGWAQRGFTERMCIGMMPIDCDVKMKSIRKLLCCKRSKTTFSRPKSFKIRRKIMQKIVKIGKMDVCKCVLTLKNQMFQLCDVYVPRWYVYTLWERIHGMRHAVSYAWLPTNHFRFEQNDNVGMFK